MVTVKWPARPVLAMTAPASASSRRPNSTVSSWGVRVWKAADDGVGGGSNGGECVVEPFVELSDDVLAPAADLLRARRGEVVGVEQDRPGVGVHLHQFAHCGSFRVDAGDSHPMVGVSLEARRWLAPGPCRGGMVRSAGVLSPLMTVICLPARTWWKAPVLPVRGQGVGGLPVAGRGPRSRLVLEEGWAPAAETGGDTALLRLAEPASLGWRGCRYGRCRPWPVTPSSAMAFRLVTTPRVPAEGQLGLAAGLEWVTLKVSPEVPVAARVLAARRSGAGSWARWWRCWSPGMSGSGGRVGFAVPVGVIAARSPVVAAALPTALDLDPDRETHWGPRSRGVSRDDDDEAGCSTGRREALRELVGWLSGQAAAALRVVTGLAGLRKVRSAGQAGDGCGPALPAPHPRARSDRPAVPPEGPWTSRCAPPARPSPTLSPGSPTSRACRRRSGRAGVGCCQIQAATGNRGRCARRGAAAAGKSAGCWPTSPTTRAPGCWSAAASICSSALPDPDPMRLDQPPYLQRADVGAYVTVALSPLRRRGGGRGPSPGLAVR